MTHEEYERWKFEKELLEDTLKQIEGGARAVLRAEGCPGDPLAILDILSGKRPAPWPKRTDAQNRRRARLWMIAATKIAEIRAHTGLSCQNALSAAAAALLVGVYAGQAGLEIQTRQHQRARGRARGSKIASTAARHDAAIRRFSRRWALSDELQDGQSRAAYIASQLTTEKRPPSAKTIRRRLQILKRKAQ